MGIFSLNIFNVPGMTQSNRILRHLKRYGYISNVDMWNHRIQRGSERIRELKEDGYDITSEHVKGSLWIYHYHGHKHDRK